MENHRPIPRQFSGRIFRNPPYFDVYRVGQMTDSPFRIGMYIHDQRRIVVLHPGMQFVHTDKLRAGRGQACRPPGRNSAVQVTAQIVVADAGQLPCGLFALGGVIYDQSHR